MLHDFSTDHEVIGIVREQSVVRGRARLDPIPDLSWCQFLAGNTEIDPVGQNSLLLQQEQQGARTAPHIEYPCRLEHLFDDLGMTPFDLATGIDRVVIVIRAPVTDKVLGVVMRRFHRPLLGHQPLERGHLAITVLRGRPVFPEQCG